MHAEQLAEMLSTHSLFADCGPDELAEIILRGNYMKYDKGHEIMGQGEEGDKLFIMLTGYARTSMIASNGREIVLDYAEAGHVVGEIAFLDGGERTASVHALDNVTALVLTRNAFDEIVSKHQGLAMRLLQSMARRLRQSNSIIEADRAFTSGPRLARYLLRLMLSDPEEERLKLDLSQSELGNFVGLSREQINRQLSSWVESGLIKLDAGRIHILNRDLLLEIAETI